MASLTTEELDLLETKQRGRSFTTEELNALEQPSLNPAEAEDSNSKIYDISSESKIPQNEAKQIYFGTMPLKKAPAEATALSSRFGKQLYNNVIANTLHILGKSDISGVQARAYELVRQWEKEENITLSDELFEDQLQDWSRQLTEPPETRESDYLKNEIQHLPPRPDINPFAAEVTEPEKFTEKAIDATAGILGFITQITVLRRLAPSLSQPVVWETVNLANDGKPGAGAAMQVTLAGIGKFIPGAGILPAVGRGTAGSALFGATTYLGGGDTTDILINMGIPFAFEGIGLTKQQWANYKNKGMIISSLKQKAPALQIVDDIVIDKSISDLLTNISTLKARELMTKEQILKEFAPRPPTEDLSVEIKNYMQAKRYDELLERVNVGDKKAIKELNDYIQGTNLPTYEELLERGYNGDATAFERISEGNYFQGPSPQSELRIARTRKSRVAEIQKERRLTPIEQIRANTEIIENDIRPPEKISDTDLSKARERGFITSVKEVLPQLKIEGQYVPRSTDTLAIKARNLVIDDLAKAERVALRGTSDASVATASELIKYYGEQAELATTKSAKMAAYDNAARVAVDMAAKLTELGRAVQAASILARLTPEGQIRFAAREIQRYNEKVAKSRLGKMGLKKQISNLTAEQSEYIMTEMREINKMPEGKIRNIRFFKLQNYVSDLVPTPVYRKIITAWKAGLLTGIKTSGLNIMANIHHCELEIAKDVPAAQVDKIISYFTGKRTIVPTIEGLGEGGLEGSSKGLEYLKTGYSERDIGVKLDYKKVNYNTRAMRLYTEGIFRLITAEDQPFYYAMRLRSLYSQAKAAAINNNIPKEKLQKYVDNLVSNPTDQMIKYAAKDAETAVFINQTKLGDLARGIQRLPGGEIIVPFGRTPSAIAMQIINYSPVGIVKTIYENIGKGNFDQRAFSQGIGRGITGTATLVMGAKAYQAGILTLNYPENERERKLWELEGRVPNSIKIGGSWRSVQVLGPAGNLLIIGGHFQKAIEESGSPTEAMSEAIFGSAKSFTEQTFLRGVNQFVSSLADPERSASYVVGNTIASIIPTILADVARATDIVERRPETVPERIMTRIPGLREMLEPQITVLGEEKEPTANPLELMLDPTRPSEEISTPVIKELRRLWDEGWEVSPTLLGDKKSYESLSQEENTELWKRAGQITSDGLETLFQNPLYDQLSDEKKAEVIGKLIVESQKIARTEAVAEKLTGLKDEELTTMLFELRRTGLATEDIIPIALSKRRPEKARKIEREKKKTAEPILPYTDFERNVVEEK